jgi:hypothetical protein
MAKEEIQMKGGYGLDCLGKKEDTASKRQWFSQGEG